VKGITEILESGEKRRDLLHDLQQHQK